MGDVRIESRFKNAVLYNAMVEVCGRLAAEEKEANRQQQGALPLIRATSEHTGVSRSVISRLLNLQTSPYDWRTGQPRKSATELADHLGKPFTELFPRAVYALKLPRVVVKEVESEDILSLQDAARQKLLPSSQIAEATGDLKEVLDKALKSLTPRQEKVLRLRFGLDGDVATLEEIGSEFSVSKSRIREIECKALRDLRHPSRSRPLLLAARECGVGF